MLRDIFDITDHRTKFILRLFKEIDLSTNTVNYEDIIITYDNIDEYSDVAVDCIVATNKEELMIEGTR